jgi:hypothetical protein
MASGPKPSSAWLMRRMAYKPARPARLQRPLGALERIERVTTVARARRAASAARLGLSGYGTSHSKVFTVSMEGTE